MAAAGARTRGDAPAEVLRALEREEVYQRVLLRLFLLLKHVEEEDPAGVSDEVLASFLDPLRDCLAAEGSLVLGERGGYLYLNGVRARLDLEGFSALRYLVQVLYAHELQGLLFEPGLSRADLLGLLALVLDRDAAPDASFSERLERAGVRRIHPIAREVVDEGDRENLYRLDPGADFSSRKTWFKSIFIVKHLLAGRSSSCPVGLDDAVPILQELAQALLGEESFLRALDDLKDWDAGLFSHSVDVALISVVLGRRMGFDNEHLAQLGVSALFHDIGHVGLGRAEERGRSFRAGEVEEPRRHASRSFRRLAPYAVGSAILERAALIAWHHHEPGSPLPHPRPDEEGRRALMRAVVEVVDRYDRLLHGVDDGVQRLPREASTSCPRPSATGTTTSSACSARPSSASAGLTYRPRPRTFDRKARRASSSMRPRVAGQHASTLRTASRT
ncbi:MAG: HD domain-containing protein [Planctomycetota bacterium]